jgi:hypothetical protein
MQIPNDKFERYSFSRNETHEQAWHPYLQFISFTSCSKCMKHMFRGSAQIQTVTVLQQNAYMWGTRNEYKMPQKPHGKEISHAEK